MALSLASINKTKPKAHPIVLLYAVEKVGKSSLAAEFPAPVFIQTNGENPPADCEVDSFTPDAPLETIDGLFEAIEALFTEEHAFETFVIDSADGLEKLVQAEACKRNNWPDIEAPGYGKGYVAAEAIWNEVIVALTALRDQKGMNVVLISHAETFRFDSPTSDPYARYRPNLRKSTSDLIQAAADIIAFINYRVSIKKEDVGFNNTVKRGEGSGQRIIYLEERPGFIAGNRYGMPPDIHYKKGEGFKELAKYLPKAAA